MWWRKRVWFIVGALFLLGILSACQPQVVEVEVTRVVTETMIEEVEVEWETIEVEVTREVEAIEEIEVESVVDLGASAVGSEEDDEESPFVPTPGPKVVETREVGWIEDTTAVASLVRSENQETAERSSDVVLVTFAHLANIRQKNVMAPQSIWYSVRKF